jgi:hypothetical protein
MESVDPRFQASEPFSGHLVMSSEFGKDGNENRQNADNES